VPVVANVPMSFKLTTGHTVRVVFPGDAQFANPDQLKLAMLEASIALHRLADNIQAKALER